MFDIENRACLIALVHPIPYREGEVAFLNASKIAFAYTICAGEDEAPVGVWVRFVTSPCDQPPFAADLTFIPFANIAAITFGAEGED
jgi:hypothetical protein